MGYCIECGEFPSEGMGFGLCRYCSQAKREKDKNFERFKVKLTNEQILDKLDTKSIDIKNIISQCSVSLKH